MTRCRCGAISGVRFAEGVESVFDDIVPGRTDDVQENLAGKFRKSEPLAYLAAVENDHARRCCRTLAPFGQHLAVAGE